MAWALADAAADTGIGLTLLPVLYERAGFTQPALRDDQRRFAHTTAPTCWPCATRVRAGCRPLL
jgi:formimidoylglutamate deiminase